MAKCARCGKFKFFWQFDANQVFPGCAYAIKREQEEYDAKKRQLLNI